MADEGPLRPHSMLHDSGNWGATCKQKNGNVCLEGVRSARRVKASMRHHIASRILVTSQHHVHGNDRNSQYSAWSTPVWQILQLLRVAPAALGKQILVGSQSPTALKFSI